MLPASDAPMGKGVGHVSRALAPLHACLRILGWVVFEHEATGDVLLDKTRVASRLFPARVTKNTVFSGRKHVNNYPPCRSFKVLRLERDAHMRVGRHVRAINTFPVGPKCSSALWRRKYALRRARRPNKTVS